MYCLCCGLPRVAAVYTRCLSSILTNPTPPYPPIFRKPAYGTLPGRLLTSKLTVAPLIYTHSISNVLHWESVCHFNSSRKHVRKGQIRSRQVILLLLVNRKHFLNNKNLINFPLVCNRSLQGIHLHS